MLLRARDNGAVCAAASRSGRPRLAPKESVEGPIPTRYTCGCGFCTGRGENGSISLPSGLPRNRPAGGSRKRWRSSSVRGRSRHFHSTDIISRSRRFPSRLGRCRNRIRRCIW